MVHHDWSGFASCYTHCGGGGGGGGDHHSLMFVASGLSYTSMNIKHLCCLIHCTISCDVMGCWSKYTSLMVWLG